MIKRVLFTILILEAFAMNGQFHSLTMPSKSPRKTVTQQIGVTNVAIAFGSPSVRGRNVWENPGIIPQNGNPIPWRAGANENTTISFDTEVYIEGQKLEPGSYGFHILPNGHQHTILIAQKDNLWGSYYLNVEEDVILKTIVEDTVCSFSEQLDFEFLNQTDSSATIALEWGNRRIPFQLSVDLNKTTIEKFRYELNGVNTYQWEAWNDAAEWCLMRNINLKEALTWADRSINGGYGGFAYNYNLRNFGTKIMLLDALNMEKEMNETISKAMTLSYSIDEAHVFGGMFIELGRPERAVEFFNLALKKYENEWGVEYMMAIAYYSQDNLKKAKQYLKKCGEHAPDFFAPRVEKTLNEMTNNTYSYPRR